MRRRIMFFGLVLFMACAGNAGAQNFVTENDWSAIIKLLETEKWPQAEKMTHNLLMKAGHSADTTYEGANLRYMFMVSVAGQLAHKTIDKETALKKTKPLIGQMIITPGRTIKAKGLFNYFSVSSDDSTKVFSCQTNNGASEIQIFEHYEMKDSHMLAEIRNMEGTAIRIKARIKSIAAEGFGMPRLAVQLTEGIYRLQD